MHMCLQKPWAAAFEIFARNPKETHLIDPFNTADGLREPIFYSGESAYNFQYEELARLRYQADNGWLHSNLGFTIEEACLFTKEIGDIQIKKVMGIRTDILNLHPDQWSFLPGFTFTVQELSSATNLQYHKIIKILNAFSINLKKKNSSFSSLSAFNETNAAPIIKLEENYILLQHYSILEALYEAPFFWMASDRTYSATASKNRGAFAENFTADRFLKVFGSKYVFRNVDIYKGRDRIAEADALVLYGDYAIVSQVKSKRLAIEARKGNDLQLKDDFKKAIHHAYDQAANCAKALLDAECKFISNKGAEIFLSKRPTKIFPICAVSDHYPALAAQAWQFLRVEPTGGLQPPLITDVFFLDVLTEMLETPLHFINYLTLRAKFHDRVLLNQEMTALGYHLKHNLWLEDQYSMVNLGDDFTASLDIAMSARRLGIAGNKIPKGVLTRFKGTTIGRLISEFESRAIPELIGFGMQFLQLGSQTAKHINKGIERLLRSAANDGRHHDISIPFENEKSGFTIHISGLPEEAARERLAAHCRIKKYEMKSDLWYGLLLAPGRGDIRGALAIEEKWEADAKMESALNAWPKKPIVPIATLSQGPILKKFGRNKPCLCGSGKKYKKCCLR